MRCPFCGSAETKVIDSRFNEDSYSIKRRRECLSCKARFNTLETSELNYPRVIKSDESSEIFNETKIRRGINRAFEKRKISSDEIDELAQKVLTKCSQYPNKEIPSSVIGETIMRELILIDQVAYLRFASVYLRFNDVNSFKSIIENIEKQPSPSMLKNQKKLKLMSKDLDNKYMDIAIELAKKGKYRTHPNPLVGAVIVKDNKIISKGFHKRFRGKHAEREAIDKSTQSLIGSTMYVTLEPCHHHGNTPPCVDAIIESKISRVVIATKDPNPLVNEKSITKLRDNGIDVKTGVRESEAKELNKSFFYKYSSEKPYMRLKFGVSIDGKIANQKRESKWITSEASRNVVQSKRAEVNAILTTSNTILADNPFMNIRDGKILKQIENQPALIVLDSKLRISDKANIFKTKNRLVIIITDIQNTKNMPIRTFKDNVVVKFVQTKNRRIMLHDIYDIANAYNLNDILVECGNTLASSLFQDNAVDEIMYFVAPKIIGHQGYNFSGINPVRKLSDKIPLKIKEIKKINKDLYLNMRR